MTKWLVESFYTDDLYGIDEQDEYDIMCEAVEELLDEGANIENTRTYREGKKQFKTEMKLAKKALKAGDRAKAKQHVSNMEKGLDKMEKNIRETEGTAGSAVAGFFAAGLLNTATIFVPFIGPSIGVHIIGTSATLSTVAGCENALDAINKASKGIAITTTISSAFNVGSYISSIIILIEEIIDLVKEIKNPKTKAEDAVNLYRNKLLRYTNDLKKKVAKFKQAL